MPKKEDLKFQSDNEGCYRTKLLLRNVRSPMTKICDSKSSAINPITVFILSGSSQESGDTN